MPEIPKGLTQEHYGEFLFSSAHPEENERLEALAAAFDPISAERLLALGISSGSRCLDVGGGTGSLASWITGTMGCSLTVVDRDTTLLTETGGINVIEADVTDPQFYPGTFDLVHARFLLMHLRERDSVLRRMATWVRPGGTLVLSDALNATPSSHEPFRATETAFKDVLSRTIGSDHTSSAGYHDSLDALGFEDITTHTHEPVVGIDTHFTRFVRLTLSQAREGLMRNGLPAATLEAALDHVSQPGTRESFFSMLTVSGRAPANESELEI
ncbi:class I SAM-dependent methyltransferase [Streptomyces lavendulae]|uniref:class I SAM-dependent methyltransferase n=1 Tax=Streptomyces lavendulae TaxID=1914 RepID=UPI003408ED38